MILDYLKDLLIVDEIEYELNFDLKIPENLDEEEIEIDFTLGDIDEYQI